MTSIILAAALSSTLANQGWKPVAPYAEGSALRYDLKANLDMGGNPTDVEITLEHKTTKKTDGGFEGTSAFTQVIVNGNEMDGMSMDVSLSANGVLKSVKSDLGSDMRRMFMAFYFCYPTDAVGDGGTWSFQDAEATGGHKAKFEYTLAGAEDLNGQQVMKVKVVMSEDGSDPMKATGFYWVASDGKIAKFELNIKGWPVPVAGQAFDATIKGTLKK